MNKKIRKDVFLSDFVVEFIEKEALKTGDKFSYIVNKMLREAIKEKKENE